MKQKLELLLLKALEIVKLQGALCGDFSPEIGIERTRDAQHGDYASNVAMVLAKSAKTNPRLLAEKIVAALPQDDAVSKVEIAGPGFINFFINPHSQYRIVPLIHDQGRRFGCSAAGAGKKIQVEFVSANPTGPLHVGHGRGAAYGSAVANLLEAAGFEVERVGMR